MDEVNSRAGCCINQFLGYHRRCICDVGMRDSTQKNVSREMCQSYCDDDEDCKGYTLHKLGGSHMCEIATISECTMGIVNVTGNGSIIDDKCHGPFHNDSRIGALDLQSLCGYRREAPIEYLYGCFIKQLREFIYLSFISLFTCIFYFYFIKICLKVTY